MTTRDQLAAALSTVLDVTGYPYRPASPRTGDAWPLLASLDRADGSMFTVTWRVLVALPSDERAASEWIDTHRWPLVDALEPLAFVDRLEPVLVTIARTDTYALQITIRSE